MAFEKIINESELILTEGGLVERLKAEYNVKMHPDLNHASLIYENQKILELIYRQYINIGQKFELPIMILTPTRKVNSETIKRSNYRNKNLISDSCLFLNKIKNSYNYYSKKIMIGGLLGCKGDAYSGK